MIAALSRRLAHCRSGTSVLELALALPFFLGFSLGGLEMSNYALALITTQRLATSLADMFSQSGLGDINTTESQVYDLFYALNGAARPLNMNTNGRAILTVIKGVTQSDGSVRNEFADTTYSQQFEGGLTTAVPLLGCRVTTSLPTFSRILPAGEILVHAQVTYSYRPLFASQPFVYFQIPTIITRTATYRMRKNQFQITGDSNHPAKSNCNTIHGT